MSLQIQCTNCSVKLKVPQKRIGTLVRCPKCGSSLEVPRHSAEAPETAPTMQPKNSPDDVEEVDWTYESDPASQLESENNSYLSPEEHEETRAEKRERIRKKQVEEDVRRFRRDGSPNPGRFKCPYCASSKTPITLNETSLAGWIVFAVMIFVCVPLCFIGWFITEENHYCGYCKKQIK